ncbi:MAG: hypothetical protein KatS3mg031_2160 [Chitinophagales bacterium]|nr:MAG: hypothetical protein KatS3mg031_2160 [Chitinophagales bacterium]
MAVPLQPVKTFRNGKEANGWTNMLIFGDNLQVLKTLLQMKQEGKLKNADDTPGVRLVYIDPPFATKQKFRGSQDQKAYQDKLAGARFLEFLRKRLVFLRELLREDGSIFVHLDYKKGHYVKTLMDEIFDEPNFRNEIIVKRGQKNVQAQFETMDSLASGHDVLLFYSKVSDTRFPILKASLGEIKPGTWNNHWRGTDRPTMRYELFGIMPDRGQWRWSKERTMKAVENYERYLKQYSKKMSIDEYWRYVLDTTGEEIDFVRLSTTGKPEHYVPPTEHRILSDVWIDIVAYQSGGDYPTQKSEDLLNRIIYGFSNPGDLVLDCFAGSGTTLAVAEKLGRRWIGVDCEKLAIYTMQKRLLNIADSKDLEDPKKLSEAKSASGGKYGKPPKPFTLYNAGLYDYKMIKELPFEQYRDFALKLFQCLG